MISAAVGSTGAFAGELSWVDGGGNVCIKEKYIIVDDAVSRSLGGVLLVIGSPRWRRSHAALEKNGVK